MNGKAIAIECFLDLKYKATRDPAIRWTGFNRELDTYQGELVNKDEYTRIFFEAIRKDRSYDLKKLTKLWKHLLAHCTT